MANCPQTCVLGEALQYARVFLFFLVALALKKMYFMGKKVVYELYSIERFVGIPLWDAQRR